MSNRPLRLQAEQASLLDGALICASLLAALVTHKILCRFFGVFADFDMFWGNAWFYIPLVAIWCIVFNSSRLYQELASASRLRLFYEIFRLSGISLAILLAFFYSIRVSNIPRTLLALQCIYAILFVSFRACFLQPFLLRRHPPLRILAVGAPGQAARFREWLAAGTNGAILSPVAYLVPAGETPPEGFPIAASSESLPEVLRTNVIDTVAILSDGLLPAVRDDILRQCTTQGIEVWLDSPLFHTSAVSPVLDEINGLPALVFNPTPHPYWALAVKRAMDILLSAAALLLLAPLFLVIALAVRLTSPGPAFFAQRRCTIHGRTFRMFKFRTMVADAETRLSSLADRNEVSGPVFKIRDDPRITRIGRFLRRYSLDELPQLVNVFLGDMSLVGPPPPIPDEVAQYEDWQRRRLSMRTGCTCLWQVGGRNDLSFDDWMKLDLRYIDDWSLALDIRILFQTVFTVIRGTGC